MKLFVFFLGALICLCLVRSHASDQYFAGDGSLLSAAKWGPSSSGPFASTFTTNNTAVFAITNGTGRGASIRVAGIVATESFTLTSAGGTITNINDGIVPIDVATGKTLDFKSQSFTTSAYAGYIKNGAGVLALNGGDFGGGFTLNEGTVVMRNANAMGDCYNNLNATLTINGGIIASTGTYKLNAHYLGGIFVGGDFQLGATTGLATPTAGLTFVAPVLLGGTTRTITLGNNGVYVFSGTISSSGVAGMTFASTPGRTGRFEITGTNTFTGPVAITGGEVRFASDAALGNAANGIVINGGNLATSGTLNIASGRSIAFGNAIGSAINTSGTGATLTYNGEITNNPGETGSLIKKGTGTLVLGGTSNYSGNTVVQSGTLRMAAPNALPRETTMSLGASGATTVGTFNLDGNDQEVAGLVSVPGINGGPGKNVITSETAATLTLGGTGSYAFGAGTSANSGVIAGAVSVVKQGSGTQTLGDANSYSGGTWINDGRLAITGNGTLGSGAVVIASGTLDVTGIGGSTYTFTGSQSVSGAGTIEATGKTVMISGTLSPGNADGQETGTLTVNGNLALGTSAVAGMTLAGTGVNSYDRVAGIQEFTLTATINVDLALGFVPRAGDRFDLFDWSGTLYDPGFDPATQLKLPALPDGQQWDSSQFLVDGSIMVIPEASAAAMLLVSCALLGGRRTRRP